MTGNMTFTRVPKKTFTSAEASVILDHISKKSAELGSGAIPAYAVGYLTSMLVTLASKSPSAERELLGDVEFINFLHSTER